MSIHRGASPMGFRSSATKRRAQLRRGAKSQRLIEVVAGLVGFVKAVVSDGGAFRVFVDDFGSGRARLRGRHGGDLVPIPPITGSIIVESFSSIDVVQLVNLNLAGINYLYGGHRAVAIPSRASAIQRSAQLRFVYEWWNLVRQASRSQIDHKTS